jgi:serine/threonine-protein phosphatase PGAM5
MHAHRWIPALAAVLALAAPAPARPQAGSAAAVAAPAVAPPAAPARRPRGTRTIVLVRHGLYDEDDPADPEVGRHLTPDGREQARLTAGRLAHFQLPIDVLRSSTMTRARETAAIIADSLPGRAPIASRDLCECTAPSERKDIEAGHAPAELDSCRDQLERAYAAIFRPSPDRDTTEVVVCHGNVMRYFVCRALGIDPTWWLRFGIQNCGVTIIRVRADGTASLLSYDDFGHLPPRLITSLRPSAPRDTTRR